MVMNATLAALVLVVIPPLYLVTAFFARRLRTASRETRRLAGRKTAVAEETLSYLPLVQAYSHEGYERERFQEQGEHAVQARLHATRLSALNGRIVTLIGAVGGMVVIWVGAHQLVQGQLTIGALIAAMGYVRALYSPLSSLAGLVGSLQSTAASVERVAELLDLPLDVDEPREAQRIERAAGRIDLLDVWFGYHEDRPVLRGLTLAVEAGTRRSPSSAEPAPGKTTISNLLERMYDPMARRDPRRRSRPAHAGPS